MNRAPHPFRALLRKELIELSRFALPALLLSAIFVYLDLRPKDLRQSFDPAERFQWLLMANFVLGLVFGVTQTWRESRTDAWAFAVHRPVSRTAIFFSKVVAGQLALLGCLGLPYVVGNIWVAMPGHIGVPYHWTMALPGVADMLAGFLSHAAGLLIGARQKGRVARPILFATAVVGVYAIASPNSIGTALTAGLILTVVVLAAAWGTFTTADDFAAQRPVARVGNVLSLVPAAVGVYALVMLVASAFVSPDIETLTSTTIAGGGEKEAFITEDGRLVRARIQDTVIDGAFRTIVSDVADLDGTLRPDLTSAYAYKDPLLGIGYTESMGLANDWLGHGYSYRSPYRVVQRLFPGPDGQIWYFERPHRLISVYDRTTRRRINWVGPDGVTPPDSMPTRRFEGDLMTRFSFSNILMFSGAVYAIEYPKPPRRIFLAPPGDTITDIGVSNSRASRVGLEDAFVVTTTKGVYILTGAGSVVLRSPHPSDVTSQAARVWWAPRAPGMPTFIWYPAFRDSLNRVLVYRMGDTLPVRRYEFAGAVYDPNSHRLGPAMIRRMQGQAAFGIDPDRRVELASTETVTYVSESESYNVFGQRPSRRVVAWGLIAVVLSVGIVWLVGRRYVFGRTWAASWTVAALFGGPLALIILWIVTEFPARVPCHSCGRQRLVTRFNCEHCGAAFTGPATDDTEVIVRSALA